MRKSLILLLLTLILSSTEVYSEGITPGKVEVDFTPNAKAGIPFTVKGYEDINVETDCPELSYNNDATKQENGEITFTAALTLPSKQAGPKECGVKVSEKTKTAEGLINTRIDLIASVTINAPYPGEYVLLDLVAHNANKGDPINFEITAKNLGDKTVKNAQATIELVKDGEIKTTLLTDKADITSMGSAEYTKKFETSRYEAGRYKAIARLAYEDRTATDEEKFIIGTHLVEILTYPEEIEIGGMKQLSIGIESLWGKGIENAYAEITISNKKQMAELKTASTTINPWEQTTLNTEINTSQFAPGVYNAKINIFYNDKISTETGQITFKLPEVPKKPIIARLKEAATDPISLAVLAIAIITADILWLKTRKQKRPHNPHFKTKR